MSFKDARVKAGLSLAQAGEKLGITDSAVSQWENEKALPDVRRLREIARVYGCAVDDLLDGIKEIKCDGKQNKSDSGEMP